MLKLIAEYKRGDPFTTRILSKYEIHILPISNPDGYVHSQTVKSNTYFLNIFTFLNFIFLNKQSRQTECGEKIEIQMVILDVMV